MIKKLPGVLYLVFALCCNPSAVKSSPRPQTFSFGIIADAQYADKDKKSGLFRESLGNLKKCVKELNNKKLAFTIQLGDIIDGNSTAEKTLLDLNSVLEVYNTLTMPRYHVVGNHCLEADKTELHKRLKLSSFYYDFTVPAAEGWRFIVLDGNDAGYGVLSENQSAWFGSKLKESRRKKEKVIVFNHFALLESVAPRHRMKKPEPVLKLINESGCVVAYFAGHDHPGGYAFQDGIHHITVRAMLIEPVRNSYAIIEVSPTKLEEIGFGGESSREMKIMPKEKEKTER